jgi:hypothetical protein
MVTVIKHDTSFTQFIDEVSFVLRISSDYFPKQNINRQIYIME